MEINTKKSLKRNGGVIVYAVIIVAMIILSGVIEISLDTLKVVMIIMGLLILGDVFTQALQHEPEETRKKVRTIVSVIMIILLILGIAVFLVY